MSSGPMRRRARAPTAAMPSSMANARSTAARAAPARRRGSRISHATGRLKVGDRFVHESYICSRFTGRIEAEDDAGRHARHHPLDRGVGDRDRVQHHLDRPGGPLLGGLFGYLTQGGRLARKAAARSKAGRQRHITRGERMARSLLGPLKPLYNAGTHRTRPGLAQDAELAASAWRSASGRSWAPASIR